MQFLHALLHRAAPQCFQAFAFCSLLFAVCFSHPAFAHHFDEVELKVWSAQNFDDPFCSDDPIDVYFRVSRPSYVTVYQINPYGGVEILYPLSCHRWQAVYPGRAYRLTDLSADLDFFYDGLEGNAYIGMVATRHPIDIVPWLEAGFRNQGLVFGRPSRVTVGVDFRLVLDRVFADVRVRLGSVCASAHYVAPIYVRPRVVLRHSAPVVVWPEPPRHKSYPSKWGYRHDNRDYRPPAEPQEKRPIRRRGNEAYDGRERNSDSEKSRDAERSPSGGSADKRTEEVKVKNDSRGSESSSGSERRTKKPRN